MAKNADIGPKIGIDGEAEYRKSLEAISSQLKTMGTEMGVVTAQFAKNASSQEAVTAKTAVLNKQIDAQREKLKLQQGMLAKATAEFGEADSRTQQWAQVVNKSTAALYKMENSLENVGKELDGNGESALRFGDVLKAHVIGDFIVSGIKKVASAVKQMGGEFLQSAADVKASTSQVEQTFGDMGGEAQAAIDRVADASGIMSERLKGTATQMFAFAKVSGADEAQGLNIMERAMVAAADSAAYYDRSLDDTIGSLQSFLKGNYANDAALGLSATETTRNAKAMDLFGKKFKDLTEIQKQEALLSMVEDANALSGAMGQAQREADGWANVQDNLTAAWGQFQAKIGTPFLENLIPIVQEVSQGLQDMTQNVDWDKFNAGVGFAFEMFEKLMNGDLAGFGEMWGEVVDSMVEGLSGLGSYLSENMPDLTSFALDLIASAAFHIRENAGKLVDGGLALIQGLAQGLADSIPVLLEKVPGIISDLAGAINDNAPKLLKAAVKLIITLGKGLIAAIPALLENIGPIVDAIVDVFTAFNWLNLGKTLITSLGKGLTAAKDFLIKTAQDLWKNFKDSAVGLPTEFGKIGKNIIQGLINGLKSMWTDAVNHVKEIGTGLVSALRTQLGIRSPSRVFASIGEYMMEGLVIGMEDSKGNVMETAQSIVDEVKHRFDAMADTLNARQDIGNLQYQLWEMTAGKSADEMEKYDKRLEMLGEQEKDQAGIVEAAQAAYDAVAQQYGINSDKSFEYQKQLLEEKIAYEKLKQAIQDVIDKQNELYGGANVAGSYSDLSGNMRRGSSSREEIARSASADIVNGMSTAMSGAGGDLVVKVNVGDAELARAILPEFRKADKSNPEVVSDRL